MDEQTSYSDRGTGDTNQSPCDDFVREILCERLFGDPAIDASHVAVSVSSGQITLEGTVDSRRTRRAIEDVAEQIGAQDVENNLRVVS